MELLTVTEVAKRLKLTRETVYRLIKTDLTFPPHIKIGKSLRFDKDDIENYLKRNKKTTVL